MTSTKTSKEMALAVNGDFFRFVLSFWLWSPSQNLTMIKKLFLVQVLLVIAKMHFKVPPKNFQKLKVKSFPCYASFHLEAKVTTTY